MVTLVRYRPGGIKHYFNQQGNDTLANSETILSFHLQFLLLYFPEMRLCTWRRMQQTDDKTVIKITKPLTYSLPPPRPHEKLL